jgi:hypothetical protein
LSLKNKTNKLFLPFICCKLGRSRIEKERKENARAKKKKVREKHKKNIQRKKNKNNLVNLQSPTYKY